MPSCFFVQCFWEKNCMRRNKFWDRCLNTHCRERKQPFDRHLLFFIDGFSVTWRHVYSQWLTSLASTFQVCNDDKSQLWGNCYVTTFLFLEQWQIDVGGRRRNSSENPKSSRYCNRVSSNILGYKIISHSPVKHFHLQYHCNEALRSGKQVCIIIFLSVSSLGCVHV